MWDFDFGRTLGLMFRTLPFILLRMLIYFAITFGYIAATGTGALIGYGVGHVGDDPGGFAVWGGVVGFGLVSALVYWVREYILYVVKAGHIAVLVELMDGHALPHGKGQIDHASQMVKARFGEASALFVLDQLIKGAISAITGLIGGIAAFLPIPGLGGLARFINTVIRMSLTYVDEVILAYDIRIKSQNPWESARHGLVLYAQNGKVMVKNALWLTLMLYGLSIVIFLGLLAPMATLFYVLPPEIAGWSLAAAIIFAWAFKSAFLEPFAIAALMDVYFRVIEGQTPDAEWDRKLASASAKFREITKKALGQAGNTAAH